MPRPGPRPYECVRRAWHSERHKPLRGSIIQQIFRLLHDSHTSSTKKNREWQDKLPIVVLKAEEILYSKANSEAEYLDSQTLWERINDAINTIIRRDETTETGDLLPPCVEAALNLGCVPVRASRSQRNANPTSYLSHRIREPTATIHHHRPLDNNPSSTTNQFNQIQSNNATANVGSVYPLYYDNDCPSSRPQLESSSFLSPPIVVGRPVILTAAAATGGGGRHELGVGPPGCDLTLRLGSGVGNSSVLVEDHAAEDNIDLNLPLEEGSSHGIFQRRHGKEISFQHSRRDKGKLSIDGNVTRKRNNEDDYGGLFYTQPTRPASNQFTYQSKRPGL